MFKLYESDKKYIDFLRDSENKVLIDTSQKSRPYVGIVLTINNIDYYIPLSSPKEKHKK